MSQTKSAHLFQPVPMTTLWCPQITAPSEDIHHSPHHHPINQCTETNNSIIYGRFTLSNSTKFFSTALTLHRNDSQQY